MENLFVFLIVKVFRGFWGVFRGFFGALYILGLLRVFLESFDLSFGDLSEFFWSLSGVFREPLRSL